MAVAVDCNDSDGTFECDTPLPDGQPNCIPVSWRCDNADDCGDSSDEYNCRNQRWWYENVGVLKLKLHKLELYFPYWVQSDYDIVVGCSKNTPSQYIYIHTLTSGEHVDFHFTRAFVSFHDLCFSRLLFCIIMLFCSIEFIYSRPMQVRRVCMCNHDG